MVKDNPNVKFVVKPRFLENEGHLGKHRNSDHLYKYIREFFNNNIPSNLQLLDKHLNMKELINNSDCVLCTYSSAHVEAIYSGKKIINITNVPSEETADFRKNRFDIITRIIDKAECNISVFDLKDALKKCKYASNSYFKYIIEEPTLAIKKSCDIIEKSIEFNALTRYPIPKVNNINDKMIFDVEFEDIVKRRYKGWVHKILCYYENRFDNFGELNYIREKIFSIINNFDINKSVNENIEFLNSKIKEELLAFVDDNIEGLLSNKFNRSIVYDIFYENKLYDKLYDLIINNDFDKDTSYYLYLGLVNYQKKDFNSAINSLKNYLKLAKDVKYETVNAEKTKYIELAEKIIKK